MPQLLESKGNNEPGESAGGSDTQWSPCHIQGNLRTPGFCSKTPGSSNMPVSTAFIFDSSSNKVGIVFTPVQRKKLKVRCPGSHGR